MKPNKKKNGSRYEARILIYAISVFGIQNFLGKRKLMEKPRNSRSKRIRAVTQIAIIGISVFSLLVKIM